jgi:VanZ family protein
MRLKHPWIVISLVALLLLVPLPLGPLAHRWFALANTIENAGHPLVFWWLTAQLLPVVRARVSPAWFAYALAFILAVVFGLATEYAQSLIGRDASWEDARHDALGAMLALALQARCDLRGSKCRRWRPAATAGAAILAAAAAFPLGWTLTAYAGRWADFPIIWSADSMWPRRFSHWKRDGSPGLVIDEPTRDWRGYTSLWVRIRSMRSTGTEIRIRVHDATHNQELRDRYDRAFFLPDARERTLSIPLEAIKHGAAARELDLAAVRGIVIFQSGSRGSPGFAVGEVRLVR